MRSDSRKLIIGEKINRLTILGNAKPEFYKNGLIAPRKVKCICDCGNIKITRLSSLLNGRTKSCGCLKKEQESLNLGTVSHGLSKHPLYTVWKSMKQRCYDKNHEYYYNYGGRGIKVCDRWLDFTNFYNDLIGTYKKGLTLERVKNELDYSPDNCIWDTRRNQNNNRRDTTYVFMDGKKIAFSIACEIYKVNKLHIIPLLKRGYDFKNAVILRGMGFGKKRKFNEQLLSNYKIV